MSYYCILVFVNYLTVNSQTVTIFSHQCLIAVRSTWLIAVIWITTFLRVTCVISYAKLKLTVEIWSVKHILIASLWVLPMDALHSLCGALWVQKVPAPAPAEPHFRDVVLFCVGCKWELNAIVYAWWKWTGNAVHLWTAAQKKKRICACSARCVRHWLIFKIPKGRSWIGQVSNHKYSRAHYNKWNRDSE